MSNHFLFLSTAVAPLGSGRGGGVEQTIQTLAKGLARRGHTTTILAPEGSEMTREMVHWNRQAGDPVRLHPVAGSCQITAQHDPIGAARQSRAQIESAHTFPNAEVGDSALESMLLYAWHHQEEAHAILNFSYDRLPVRFSGTFQTPFGHLISMGSLYEAFDRELVAFEKKCPGRLACHTDRQAATFPKRVREAMTPLGLGIETDRYPFRETPEEHLIWMGRISPEKGVEEAIEAAERAGVSLRLAGAIDDTAYWTSLCERWPDLTDRWIGFLNTDQLREEAGRARALLMTPKWIEAFGIVAIEALACGTPVLAYNRGGPADIIQDGITGRLTPPDDPEAMANAIQSIDTLSRAACREDAEKRWSLSAWSTRCDRWLQSLPEGPCS